jgi:adenine-specific DNA-methyltransferase
VQFVWRWGKDKSLENLNDEIIGYKTNSGEYRIVQKMRHNEKIIRSLLLDTKYSSRRGTAEVEEIMEGKFFSFPKPLSLIIDLISIGCDDNSIIADLCSGSATTAHAVMQLNAEDGGNRKYICVQIPEETPEDSEARKAKFYTIPEIAKERIRRAGKKILEEQKAKNDGLFAGDAPKLDIGFKVFKLDSSNVNAWDSNPENLEAALHNSLFNIKEDRAEDDLLYEILIKYGIELTEKINRHTIAGKTVYEMGAGSLIVCLADNITTDVAEGIGKLWNEVRPEDENVKCRMVFKDSGFNGSDEMKTNTMLILKQHGITNVASV